MPGQWPLSSEESLLEQLETERAITDLVELALDEWLPLAEAAVLHAAAPPPDPAAAAEQDAQWDYLVDALVIYGIYLIAGSAFDKAYSALTGVPLAAGRAALPLLRFDMPGMPTQAYLREKVGQVLRRRLSIDITVTEQRIRDVPQIQQFARGYADAVRGRVVDAVNRVFKRTRKATDDAATPDEAREEAAPIFDPLDPGWQAAADQAGQTHATGALNAATSEASQAAATATGRTMEIVWTAILDNHTRLGHAAADGQRQPPGQAFMVDGEALRFPGDPAGSIDNTANCRCRLFAHFTEPDPELTAAGFADLVGEIHEDFNWVDDCGGLPKYIKRIAKHLEEKGMTKSQSIATAVNSVKKMCKTGDTNFPGKQAVSKMTRAQACNAVKEWEKLKACAARKRAEKAASIARAVAWAAEQNGKPYTYGTSHGSEKVAPMTDYRSFTSVLAVIGTPTDDGRMFAKEIELSFRDFPLPLMWQRQSAGGHYDAFTVGVIESAGVVGHEVIGKGYMLNTPEADEAAMQIEHGVTGPSVDLGDVDWELRDAATGQPVTEEDYWNDPDMELVQTVMSARVLAATLVSTPAFGETSIALGERVEKGEDALVAAAALPMPGVIDMPVYSSDMFADPGFSGPTLPHLTEDGRIQGHLAAFNVCHIGIQDQCVMAPRSQTDYAWFHTAPPVKTDKGSVKVGRLTVGGGHAGPRLNVGATISHYDDAGTCFALVHVGEDAHGIWFSGVPAPGATAEQVAAGLAAPLSGDWRNVGGNLELVAALAVNTPGFPLIASGATNEADEPMALVASLGPCAGEEGVSPEMSVQEDMVRKVIAEYRAAEKRDADARALIDSEVQRQALDLIGKVN